MKAKVIRPYVDKYSMEDVEKGTEFEITEERFSELTAGPLGIFVEEIKEEPLKELVENQVPDADVNPVEPPEETEPPKEEVKKVNFDNMTKAELVEYAKTINVELSMEMKKDEMVKILQSK